VNKCTNVRSLREHKKKKHPGEFLDIPQIQGDLKFRCDFCKVFFMTKDDVLNHVKIDHKDRFQAWVGNLRREKEKRDQCTNAKLLKHFYKRDGNSLKCNFCDETFLVLSNFKKHMSTVHEDKYGKDLDFICDVCGDGFLRKSALNNHSLIHLPSVTCPQCDKVFTTKMSLKKHQKFSCKSEVALKFCELCGKGFKTNYDLKKHYNNIHLNHRSYKCTICGNAFKTVTHFQTHCTGKHNIEKGECKQYLLMVKPEELKIAE